MRARIDMVGMVGSFFSYASHEDVIAALRNIPEDAEGVDVIINSPGGSFTDGVAIYNELAQSKVPVRAVVRGLAASAASLIAMGADEIVMEPGSLMMIHNASAMVQGDKDYIADMVEILGKVDKQMAGIYARRMGIAPKAAAKLMDDETWFTCEEAVEAGLADIAEGAGDAETKPSLSSSIAAVAPLLPQMYFQRVPACIAAMTRPVAALGDIPQLIKARSARVIKPATEQETQKEEVSIMAEEVKNDAPAETPAPVAATVDEIKAACAGADAAFILAQLEKKATLEQVRADWVSALQAQLSARDEEITALKTAKPGVAPMATTAQPESVDSAPDIRAQWDAAVAAQMAKGRDKASAVRAVVRENPELHELYLQAVNKR